jgi:hypothetical protein
MSQPGRLPITLLLLLLGCWLGAVPVLTADPQERTFTVIVHNRQVAPDTKVIRVQQGDTVTLRWISDETVTLHLHGYDIAALVKAGVPTALRFIAHATGRFPISTHGFGTQAYGTVQNETPVVYVEVLPR